MNIEKTTYTKEFLRDRITKATTWLLDSKIHNSDPEDTKLFGSFNNYLDTNKHSCGYAYTEITGYAVELLLDLFLRSNDPNYLEQAKLAGDWILKMQYDGVFESGAGGYLYCVNLNDLVTSDEAYSFDAGICLGALSDLYNITQDRQFYESAAKSANWLMHVMQNPDGSFKSLCNVNRKSPMLINARDFTKSVRKSWFYQNGCHHGKIAIGLLKYYSISKEPSLLPSVSSLCDWLIKQQTEKGYFRLAIGSNVSFSHTHSYAVEGLLYASSVLKNNTLLDSAKLGADWLMKLQKNDGRIPAWTNDSSTSFSYTDISAVAQAIRIWCVLYSETEDMKYKDAIERSLKYLLTMQNTESNIDSSGGFYLAELDLKLAKYHVKRLYSWATQFSIHALNLIDSLPDRKISGIDLW